MSMATRIAVMNHGRIAPGWRAERDLPSSRDPVRGGLHRRVELLDADISRAATGIAYLADGRAVPCPAGAGPAAGRATLMVRPESIHIGHPWRVLVTAPCAAGSCRRRSSGARREIAMCDGMETPLTVSQFGRDTADVPISHLTGR